MSTAAMFLYIHTHYRCSMETALESVSPVFDTIPLTGLQKSYLLIPFCRLIILYQVQEILQTFFASLTNLQSKLMKYADGLIPPIFLYYVLLCMPPFTPFRFLSSGKKKIIPENSRLCVCF